MSGVESERSFEELLLLLSDEQKKIISCLVSLFLSERE